MPELCQPPGVDAWPSADIKDLQPFAPEVTLDQLLRSNELQGTRWKGPREPLGFLASLVVGADLRREPGGHEPMVAEAYLVSPPAWPAGNPKRPDSQCEASGTATDAGAGEGVRVRVLASCAAPPMPASEHTPSDDMTYRPATPGACDPSAP